jgi:hypothetical protein
MPKSQPVRCSLNVIRPRQSRIPAEAFDSTLAARLLPKPAAATETPARMRPIAVFAFMATPCHVRVFREWLPVIHPRRTIPPKPIKNVAAKPTTRSAAPRDGGVGVKESVSGAEGCEIQPPDRTRGRIPSVPGHSMFWKG